jgi:hypothetical protein
MSCGGEVTFMRGVVWAIERGEIIVQWDDPDENVYCDPRRLEKIIRFPF